MTPPIGFQRLNTYNFRSNTAIMSILKELYFDPFLLKTSPVMEKVGIFLVQIPIITPDTHYSEIFFFRVLASWRMVRVSGDRM